MPWKRPSSQPTSCACARRSSDSVGSSLVSGRTTSLSSCWRSGDSTLSSSSSDRSWISCSRRRPASSSGARRTSSSIVRTIEAMRISLVGLEICSLASSAGPEAAAAPSASARPSGAASSTSSGCTDSRATSAVGPSCMASRIGGAVGRPGHRIRRGPGPERAIMRASGGRGGNVPELPSGTVTFLFTDLEGSTRLWEQHRAAMVPALERHDARAPRQRSKRRGGVVVKTTGDGLHAVFTTTRAALDAALGAQRALAAEEWEVPGGLKVRMGLHTGDAVARDGDYYGPATNRAARVMSSAHGGQVVVSHATEEILRDALPDDIALVDLGEHRLPDLARPERIFQVVAAGLAREFPPLRSLDAIPGNLPGQLTSLVGRARRARRDRRRAARVATRHRHRRRWRGEEPHRHPGRARRRVALPRRRVAVRARHRAGRRRARAGGGRDARRVGASGDHARRQHPRRAARTRELVLVLDNCEHLVEPVGRLAEGLLRDCPGCGSSRPAARRSGSPASRCGRSARSSCRRTTSTVDGVHGRVHAVQLFVERARAVQPGFVLDEPTRPRWPRSAAGSTASPSRSSSPRRG